MEKRHDNLEEIPLMEEPSSLAVGLMMERVF